MSKVKLAIKIDDFLYNYDPYEYQDQERYPGSITDDLEEIVDKEDFNDIKKFLNEVINDDRNEFSIKEAKELLSDITSFELKNKHERRQENATR